MFKYLILASILFLVAENAASSSVKNLKQFLPFEKIEAEDYSAANSTREANTCPDLALGYTYDDRWAAYYDVDFEDGAEFVTFRLRGILQNLELGYIYLRLGNTTTAPVASIPVSSTEAVYNSCVFANITTFLPTIISGVQDLYLTFSSSTGVDHIVDIDWFQFTRKYVFES